MNKVKQYIKPLTLIMLGFVIGFLIAYYPATKVSIESALENIGKQIMPKVPFEVCIWNGDKVKISDTQSAYLKGDDTCVGTIKGILLNENTKVKEVKFILDDNTRIDENLTVIYDDGKFMVKRPNGYIVTKER